MVKIGADRIDEYSGLFTGRRIGLVTSISGVDKRMRSTIDNINERYCLSALFAPEHGVRGNVGAGESVEEYLDPYTGVPVYSLYRKDSKKITPQMAENIDMLVYDIQDLGVRYYTFISTMYYAMQACEMHQKEMVILDRINPLGDKVEGNIIQKEYESFVGAYPLAMRYGLTCGELAEMIYQEQAYSFPMHIIPLEGWKRTMMFPDTGNIWIMPSLGMPCFSTALVYPGTCLFEGTNLSEGRGTSAPFELIGAPFVDAYHFSSFMNRKKLPGVMFSPAYFTPSSSKYEKEACEGVHIHVTDYRLFDAVVTGAELLFAFRDCYGKEFQFLPPHRENGRRSIELLFGNSHILDEKYSIEDLKEDVYHDSALFYERKKKYHRYD